jgi:hypothetical protein
MAYSIEDKENIFNEICDKIQKGRSLRSIIKDDGMPDLSTFYVWLKEDDEKSKHYAYATEARAEMIFEDILAIADKSDDDIIIDENGIPQTNHDVINRSRIRIDARKWMLSKMIPKKYGDRTDITSGGEKIQNPSVISVEIVKTNEDTSDTSISE